VTIRAPEVIGRIRGVKTAGDRCRRINYIETALLGGLRVVAGGVWLEIAGGALASKDT
jgi:hypothetical protein